MINCNGHGLQIRVDGSFEMIKYNPFQRKVIETCKRKLAGFLFKILPYYALLLNNNYYAKPHRIKQLIKCDTTQLKNKWASQK